MIGIELLVRREALVVALVGAQLGRRRLGEDVLGDELAAGAVVAVAAEPVDQQLGHVLDHREAAGGVAVEGAVADGALALVAGGEHEPAELVRQRHQGHAPDARLEVLLGEVRLTTVEAGRQHLAERGERRLDGDDPPVDAEVVGQALGVGDRVVARVARRHEHAVHAVGPERVDRDGGDDRRVDPARQADDHVAEPVLRDVVARAEDERLVHLAVRRRAAGAAGATTRGAGTACAADTSTTAGRRTVAGSGPWRHLDVGDEHRLDELGRSGHHRAVARRPRSSRRRRPARPGRRRG